MENGQQPDLNALKDLAERFAERELGPEALERDRYPFVEFDYAVVDKAASIGLLAPTVSEVHGGVGLNTAGLALILETMACHDASMAAVVFVQSLARSYLANFHQSGLDEKCYVAPENGSTLLALPIYVDPDEPPHRLKAVSGSDGLTISGTLDYVACLPVADAVIVPADLDGSTHVLLVENDRPGVSVSEPVVGLGLRGCPIADLTLDRVQLPPGNHLGGNQGADLYRVTADRYRGPLTAMALGILKGCYAAARDYAADRYQAKKQIIEHDMIRRMLADMLAWIDLGEAGVSMVCQTADSETRQSRTRALSVQELVTRAVAQAAANGVQILGGYGYMHEYGQEKRMRDAKQLQAIFGGAPVRTLRILDRAMERHGGI
jgi:alkylation response protein AidB-like acyl-CoA dehydrogenase